MSGGEVPHTVVRAYSSLGPIIWDRVKRSLKMYAQAFLVEETIEVTIKPKLWTTPAVEVFPADLQGEMAGQLIEPE